MWSHGPTTNRSISVGTLQPFKRQHDTVPDWSYEERTLFGETNNGYENVIQVLSRQCEFLCLDISVPIPIHKPSSTNRNPKTSPPRYCPECRGIHSSSYSTTTQKSITNEVWKIPEFEGFFQSIVRGTCGGCTVILRHDIPYLYFFLLTYYHKYSSFLSDLL